MSCGKGSHRTDRTCGCRMRTVVLPSTNTMSSALTVRSPEFSYARMLNPRLTRRYHVGLNVAGSARVLVGGRGGRHHQRQGDDSDPAKLRHATSMVEVQRVYTMSLVRAAPLRPT